jgi:hypothetical protein
MDHENGDERVRARAHELWEKEGRPEGRDKEHWAQAEEDVKAAKRGKGRDDKAPAASEAGEEKAAAGKRAVGRKRAPTRET